MAETSTTHKADTKLVLGPFIGNITHSSVKLWLSIGPGDADKEVFVTLMRRAYGPQSEAEARQKPVRITIIDNPKEAQSGVIKCVGKDFGTGTVTISDLEQNSKYSYQLWQDENCTIELDLDNRSSEDRVQKKDFLKPEELYFWTLPKDGFWRQLDFLLMSCHHPETKKDDGYNGFAVWHQIPAIIDEEQNGNVRFAILAGDQIYADDVEAKVLKEADPKKRRQHYFDIYKKFWDDVNYRRVLCRVPAVLMWDDHDITDGWGSREDSFTTRDSGVFKDEWHRLFATAKEMFGIMQAARNPDPLAKEFGFDTCFRVGSAGFVVADLRSNRNIRKFCDTREGKKVWIGQVWRPQQLDAIKKWTDAEREKLDTLFFVSTVVFSHGAPSLEQFILRMWFWVIDTVNLLNRFLVLKKALQWFNDKVGDLRDDINDSWGSEANQREASRALDFLFDLENPPQKPNSTKEAPVYEKKPLNVVILTGDIHTPGYSTIYSSRPEHKAKAVIPHIVATPVAYEPFSWLGEAIFRHLTKVVDLGEQKPGVKSVYTSQVSHHFCYRNVVVVSLRNYEADESQLKVKYYLEGFPEPQVMLFDLNHGAHREGIAWPVPTNTPKSLLDKLLFWRKPKPQPALKAAAEGAEIPSTPLDLPDSP